MSPASELALAPLSPLGMSASGLSSGLGVGGLGVGGAGMGGGLTVDVADAGLHAFSSVALAGGGVAGGGDSSLFSDLVSAMGAEASGAYGGAVPVSAAIPLHAPGGAAQQGEASLSPLGVTHLPGMPPAFPTPYGSALATAPDDGPILQLAELAAAESWTVMSSQGNMHVSWRQRGGRLLWRAVAEGVPAMPAMVAAAVRHTLGQWGEADGVIGQVRVLSEGGGVPWWVNDCGPCFEQVLHATTRHDSGLSKFFQQRDLVFRSVWHTHLPHAAHDRCGGARGERRDACAAQRRRRGRARPHRAQRVVHVRAHRPGRCQRALCLVQPQAAHHLDAAHARDRGCAPGVCRQRHHDRRTGARRGRGECRRAELKHDVLPKPTRALHEGPFLLSIRHTRILSPLSVGAPTARPPPSAGPSDLLASGERARPAPRPSVCTCGSEHASPAVPCAAAVHTRKSDTLRSYSLHSK
ncbi:hypothetical protein EMIHUDRAFT_437946 [Emiliania huxleyi CCMP1516]|uniref:START domain-containing protein n=2 Tax=Emiliania huxleyi TaxID=2903 RepID=A0A0D3IFC8_EMIH1|nr:hypothetical protein EMIHUDRAFT_437946 [Emiliania huxleyi CCMP1516]EOD09963.1 hypothetical protein EMIHUDRAFT_437946 [Emiliania huxleyi CCMP1516]|eukprot:XP_005762392.1 hypothetical protein EMIHUDRAFT_437946 [Emiliania huxleyi CCMP1516]